MQRENYVATSSGLRRSLSDSWAAASFFPSSSRYLQTGDGTGNESNRSYVRRPAGKQLSLLRASVSPPPKSILLSSHIAHDGTHGSSSPVMSKSRKSARRQTTLSQKINHLISLTDKVLTKRTQLQHEEETLDSYQSFLHESTRLMMAVVTSNLSHFSNASPKKKKKRKKKDIKTPEDVSTSISQPALPHESLEIQSMQENDALAAPSLEVETQNDLQNPVDILLERHRKYESDYEAFNLQRVKISKSRIQLTTLEYRLRRKQEEFVKLLQSLITVIPEVEHAAEADSQSIQESLTDSKNDSRSSTPTLLADYFDRKGDIGVFRDRLNELDYHFHEGLDERELISDRGDPLETSHEQFQSEYEAHRRVIEADLEAAKRDTIELAQRCEDAGIDTSATRVPSSSDALSTPGRSAIYTPGPTLPSNALIPSGPQPRDAEFSRRSSQEVDRIMTWLDYIPNETSEDQDPERPSGVADNGSDIQNDTSADRAFAQPSNVASDSRDDTANVMISNDLTPMTESALQMQDLSTYSTPSKRRTIANSTVMPPLVSPYPLKTHAKSVQDAMLSSHLPPVATQPNAEAPTGQINATISKDISDNQ